MKPTGNPLDPLGLWSRGPLAVWQIGFDMMAGWQQAWLHNVLGHRGGNGNSWPMLEAWLPAAKLFPFANLLPKIDALVQPVRTPDGQGEAARVSMRVNVPAAGGNEQLAVEALIARKQGRATPWLGCLTGAQVVMPPAQERAKEAAPVIEGEAQPILASVVKASRARPVSAKAGGEKAPAAKPKATAKPAAKPKAVGKTAARSATKSS